MKHQDDLTKIIQTFKLKDYMGVWIKDYTFLKNLENQLEKFNITPYYGPEKLFVILDFKNKYDEIQDLIKKFKQVEFQGDNIEDDIAKFVELDDKIEDKVVVITEMIKVFENIIRTKVVGKDVDFLEQIKYSYTKSGNNSRFISIV